MSKDLLDNPRCRSGEGQRSIRRIPMVSEGVAGAPDDSRHDARPGPPGTEHHQRRQGARRTRPTSHCALLICPVYRCGLHRCEIISIGCLAEGRAQLVVILQQIAHVVGVELECVGPQRRRLHTEEALQLVEAAAGGIDQVLVSSIGNPPALPGDSQSLTVPGLCTSPTRPRSRRLRLVGPILVRRRSGPFEGPAAASHRLCRWS